MEQGKSFRVAKIGSPGNPASGRGSKMCKGSSQTGPVDEMGEHTK